MSETLTTSLSEDAASGKEVHVEPGTSGEATVHLKLSDDLLQ